MKTATLSKTGFNYRFESEIKKRELLKELFNKKCQFYESQQLEVPLAAPVSMFLGNRPKPLGEKQVQKLFIGHMPDGNSMAIRYEGTALTAAKVAEDCCNGQMPLNLRHHYFQEMVRLEYSSELDDKHLRAFHQSGLEMFSLTEEMHKKNIADTISFVIDFLSDIGNTPCVRISHVDIVQAPLKNVKINQHDKRKIISFLENYQIDELYDILTKVNIDKRIGNLLLELAQSNVCSIEKGLKILIKYPDLYSKAIQEIKSLLSSLSKETLSKCKFDSGIYRSLDFYSGIIFQGDLDEMKECVGGGDFSGLVEAFGSDRQVYCFGMAAGVERLMKVYN